MKYRKISFNDFINNHVDEVLDKYIVDIRDMDEVVDFYTEYLFEELDGKICRLKESDKIVNFKDYIDGNSYVFSLDYDSYDEVYFEKHSGFDTFDEECDDFYNAHKDSFEYWLKESSLMKLDDIFANIFENINGDYIEVFRGMGVKNKFIKELKDGKIESLGICWTIDKQVTQEFAVGGDKQIIMNASIALDEVDWFQTVYLNLSPTLGDAEKEIRIYNNSLINLKSVEFTKEHQEKPLVLDQFFSGDKLDLPYFENQFIEIHGTEMSSFTQKHADILRDNGYNSFSEFFIALEEYNSVSDNNSKFISQNHPTIKAKNKSYSQPSFK